MSQSEHNPLTKVIVSVEGAVGCGKSAIAEEIAIALKAVGLRVSFADPAAVQQERYATDHSAMLDMYRDGIEVVIEERQAPGTDTRVHPNTVRLNATRERLRDGAASPSTALNAVIAEIYGIGESGMAPITALRERGYDVVRRENTDV